MDIFILFVSMFILVLAMYYIAVISRIGKHDKFKNSPQFLFFVRTYKLTKDKIDLKGFATRLGFLNAFIIAFTVTLIDFVNNYLLKLLIGFLVLLPLMLIMYSVLGNYYKKKEGK